MAARFQPLPKELQDDFRKFLFVVWKHLGLGAPTPIQYDIAYFLQHGPRRKSIQGFRGVAKSWITAAYVLWRLRIDPQLNFMVVSATKGRADDFTTFCLRLIYEIPLLKCLAPRTDQRCSKVAFDVGPALADQSPSVKSVGIMGQLTGSRADEIVADDIEIPGNSETQTMRDKLRERIKEFDSVLKPSDTSPLSQITYLGTPQCEDTIYAELGAKGFETRIWPARFPTREQRERLGDFLSPGIRGAVEADESLIGKSTDPSRFSDFDLMERELSLGRSSFALHFMLDTRPNDVDRYPLRLSDLIVMDCDVERAPEKVVWASEPALQITDVPNVGLNGDRLYAPMWKSPEFVEYSGSVMSIDPSGKGSDETTYAVVKFLNGFLYLTAAGAIPGGYTNETMQRLVKVAKEQKVNRIVLEENYGGGVFTELLKNHLAKEHPCAIEEVWHQKNKEARIIDTLEPVMNQHRLVVNKRLFKEDYHSTDHLPGEKQQMYRLFYQMTRITRTKGALAHEDRIDAVAMAVAYWAEKLAKDADRAMKERREELLDRELDVFLSGTQMGFDTIVLGNPAAIGRRNSWL